MSLVWRGGYLEGITTEIARWDMAVVKSPVALYSLRDPRLHVGL